MGELIGSRPDLKDVDDEIDYIGIENIDDDHLDFYREQYKTALEVLSHPVMQKSPGEREELARAYATSHVEVAHEAEREIYDLQTRIIQVAADIASINGWDTSIQGQDEEWSSPFGYQIAKIREGRKYVWPVRSTKYERRLLGAFQNISEISAYSSSVPFDLSATTFTNVFLAFADRLQFFSQDEDISQYATNIVAEAGRKKQPGRYEVVEKKPLVLLQHPTQPLHLELKIDKYSLRDSRVKNRDFTENNEILFFYSRNLKDLR